MRKHILILEAVWSRPNKISFIIRSLVFLLVDFDFSMFFIFHLFLNFYDFAISFIEFYGPGIVKKLLKI